MFTYTIYNSNLKPGEREKEEVVNFLHAHLDQYGDSKTAILKCLEFATHESIPSLGGFVLLLKEKGETKGITIVNKTGMSDYIPENILVYIAVHKEARGQGIGKKIMEKAMEIAEGDMALHVEKDNPAKKLYERLGFEAKYVEMRYKKSF
ncbi:MAG TPA: GNAT family N-acetyltransferase [Flavobacteriaceae bacterium]|nr:GNAT family N-acetyltransferase [Flavobacteriaceae bacterium]